MRSSNNRKRRSRTGRQAFIGSLLFLLACAAPGRAVSAATVAPHEAFADWDANLLKAVASGEVRQIRPFFADDFVDQELESWKYSLADRSLDFRSATILRLTDDAILFHIPTRDSPYSGDDDDPYFDFIYRIYQVVPHDHGYQITQRAMDRFNPDFISITSRIEINPEQGACSIASTVEADLPTDRLIFKLAKEFEIRELTLNGEPARYDRHGYLVHVRTPNAGRVALAVRGVVKAPRGHNQFFSIDDKNIFIRFGGFPVLPSPPPGNNGRYHFSTDVTEFCLNYEFPDRFKYVRSDNVTAEWLSGDTRKLTIVSRGQWMDNLAFYAQADWLVTHTDLGRAHLSFYFPERDRPVLDRLTTAVDRLFQWSYSVFGAYPKSSINFVVLDKFVEGGALNGDGSIVVQNAELLLDDTYIHEILHMVPQPAVSGNCLWIKEGFTNYLSFDFIEATDQQRDFWQRAKRKYLHCFDLRDEPLIKITSTAIPCYWAAYQKAPWVYRMLEAEIGEVAFQRALRELSANDDRELPDSRRYFELFERASGEDLKRFEEQWLYRRENPVLRVQDSVRTDPGGNRVLIQIAQRTAPFAVDLEMAIESESERFTRTVRVERPDTTIEIPIEGRTAEVTYDPDARLFAIIQRGNISFTNGTLSGPLPSAAQIFKVGRDKPEEIVRFDRTEQGFTIVKTTDDRVAALSLTDQLSPIRYLVDGDTLFTENAVEGTIRFGSDEQYVAEPIYPKEFVPFLLPMVDWARTDSVSLLYLLPDTKDCAIAYAKKVGAVDGRAALEVRYAFSTKRTVLTANRGLPEMFTTLAGDTMRVRSN